MSLASPGPVRSAFDAPEASTARVSLVEVSPSTAIALKVGATAARVMRASVPGTSAASVTTNVSVVAMLGAIMPAPLVQPSSVTGLPPMRTVTLAVLGRRSVVRIAVAKSSQPSGPRARCAAAMPLSTLAIGSG